MKVLIDVKKETWGRVRQYATILELNLGEAVDKLLQLSLSQAIQPNGGQNKEIG